MRKLYFRYGMRLEFDTPVTRHIYSIRCVPGNTAAQKIYNVNCNIDPGGNLSRVTDGFGNCLFIGKILEPHMYFTFCVAGVAFVACQDAESALQKQQLQADLVYPMYRYASHFTRYEENIRSFYLSLTEGRNGTFSVLEEAVYFMKMVYQNMRYESLSTNTGTTAAEAFRQGKGVCQDYAHLMIALCRMRGIYARYAAGIVLGGTTTHAWVEIYDEYWIGLDPTNNCRTDDRYIKLCHGRDYGDCMVDRGFFSGQTVQRQTVEVSVTENAGPLL